jgi:metal-responsive CopG/Arc/MetJ family transcriptional regulator
MKAKMNFELPDREEQKLIQVRVDESLYKKVEEILNKEHCSWAKFIRTCMQSFLDGRKS